MPNSKRLEQAIVHLDELEAIVVDDPIDLYYLTSLQLSLGRLFIFKDRKPVLCVDGRYAEAAAQQNLVDVQIWDWKSPLPFALPKRIGFDSLKTTYAQFEQLMHLAPTTDWVALQGPILQQRMIKDEGEIALLKEVARLGTQGYQYVLTLLKEGITEQEVACELEIFWKRHGAEGVAFSPIIAFGEHSAFPHHRASSRKLRQGDIVLIDIGVSLHHYQSDMTRVCFFGSVSQQLQHIYKLVLHAADKAYELCRPGVLIGEVDAAARNFIESSGYHFIHGLGHGVGLEVHEKPRVRISTADADLPLKPGMVLTIEPGIYLPNEGGVRLEDTIVITHNGYESLTQFSMQPVDVLTQL